MTDNMKIWDAVKQPPPHALRPITFGNLKGKSDISPQWRYQALTSQFGPCGVGWKYSIVKTWTEPGADGKVFAFSQVELFVKVGDSWSDPIPGIGGDFLINDRKGNLYCNDEAFKMATTDALGVACKMVGVAADIYAGLWDGSKYVNAEPAGKSQPTNQPVPGQKDTDRYQPKAMMPEDWKIVGSNLAAYGLSKPDIDAIIIWVADQKQCDITDRKIGVALLEKKDCAQWIKDWNAFKMMEDVK